MIFFEIFDNFPIFNAIFLSLVITAPPAPVVTILFPLKLSIPAFPKLPTCLFLYKDPSASAASSIN